MSSGGLKITPLLSLAVLHSLQSTSAVSAVSLYFLFCHTFTRLIMADKIIS